MTEQPAAPYLDAVIGYGTRGPGRFHVPGHKGGQGADPGLRFGLGDRALWLDIPQDIWGVDLGPSPTPYEEAERLAAEAYGAARTWFLTNGATQGNHALCPALRAAGAPSSPSATRTPRWSTGSCSRAACRPSSRPSTTEPGATRRRARRVRRALAAGRGGVRRSRPTCGMAADIAGCVEVDARRRASRSSSTRRARTSASTRQLPPSGLAQGADAVLTSTHKIAGSLTQSAMLHVGHGQRIDPAAVGRAIRLVRSTSPSSLLLASLDGARRQMALHGEQLLHETLQAIDECREKLTTIASIALVDSRFVGRRASPATTGCGSSSTRETGRTGYEVAETLRRSYDVNAELATQATVVFLVGLGERRETLLRLAGDLEEVVKRIGTEGSIVPIVRPPATLRNEMAVAPRAAFLGTAEEVGVDDAVGRVSCESIAGYPPGIPALLPGERISTETVNTL
jgi:arginine/lysine/ornithine decarboxylase